MDAEHPFRNVCIDWGWMYAGPAPVMARGPCVLLNSGRYAAGVLSLAAG